MSDLLPPGQFSFQVSVTFARVGPGRVPGPFGGFAIGPAPFGPWTLIVHPLTPQQQVLTIGNSGPGPTDFNFSYQDPQGSGFPPALFGLVPAGDPPLILKLNYLPFAGCPYRITVLWRTVSNHTEYVSRSKSLNAPVFVARQEVVPGGNIDWSEGPAQHITGATKWIVYGGSLVWLPTHIRGSIYKAGTFPSARLLGQGVGFYW